MCGTAGNGHFHCRCVIETHQEFSLDKRMLQDEPSHKILIAKLWLETPQISLVIVIQSVHFSSHLQLAYLRFDLQLLCHIPPSNQAIPESPCQLWHSGRSPTFSPSLCFPVSILSCCPSLKHRQATIQHPPIILVNLHDSPPSFFALLPFLPFQHINLPGDSHIWFSPLFCVHINKKI